MYSTDKTMGFPCEIHVFDIRDGAQMGKLGLTGIYEVVDHGAN